MIKDPDKSNVAAFEAPPANPTRLPYAVELWNLPRTGCERVLGRAGSVGLARAIFTAALAEHLGRRIVLRRGAQVLAESD